jgi:DNA mismatch repair protein MSH4
LHQLKAALANTKSTLAQAVQKNFCHSDFEILQGEIERYIKEDTTPSKSALHMRMQICFAVKPGISGLLDVARKTYSETIEGK